MDEKMQKLKMSKRYVKRNHKKAAKCKRLGICYRQPLPGEESFKSRFTG